MKKQILLSLLICLMIVFGFGCRSKTVVKKLANSNSANTDKTQTKKIDGVMYNLPKTVIQVTIPVIKASESPGEFEEFAPCFFSKSESDKRVKKKDKSFSINPPKFDSRGVADTSETYVIKTKGKYFESKTLFVEYAPNTYILQKGESESKNETLEFTAKAIATAAGIAAKITPLSQGDGQDDARNERLGELGKEFNCYQQIKKDDDGNDKAIAIRNDLDSARAKVEEEMRLVGRAVAIDNQKIINFYKENNEYRKRYKIAEQLFKNLGKLIQESDGSLSGGGNNVPPDTYKIMREKNAQAIKAHRAAFLGLKSEESWAATFEFDPPKANESYSGLLFSYSEKDGICSTGQLKAKSIQIGSGFAFSNDAKEKCELTKGSEIKAVWLKVEKSDDQNYLNKIQAANENAAKGDKSRGWYYRVPAKASVTLQTQDIPCQVITGDASGNKSCLINSFVINQVGLAGGGVANRIFISFTGIGGIIPPIGIDSKQIAFNEMLVAQLGVVASVPASTSGRSSVTAIMLDPATGAMKNFKVSSSPLVDKAILDDAQKAANSAVDAADPLNRKKRELEEIKTQNQINEEKKKLTNSNTSSPDNEND